MQALDTTLEKLKMLSDDNYIKAVDVINGLLNMQGTTTTSATDNITEEDNDNLDDLADDIFNKCTAAFARMA
jgi:fructose-1,6-bisphosphatase